MSSSSSTPKSSSKGKKTKRFSDDSAGSPYFEVFSPQELTPSRSPTQGNLTGSARKVKDAVADWYNYIDKWESCCASGGNTISQLGNIKMAAIFSKKDEDSEESGSSSSYPEEMEKFCHNLKKIVDTMEKIVTKFESLTSALKGVCDLELHQNAGHWDSVPLFQTWHTGKFYEVSAELLGMYQKELSLKRTIIQNVAHCTDRDVMMFMTSAWINEPYIETRTNMLVDSMLLETGHKS